MIILIISVVVIGILTHIVTRNESREEDERPMNKQYPYRFTADRHDPGGYERHKGVGAVRNEELRDMLKEEGFCEERINRLINSAPFIISYDYFLI